MNTITLAQTTLRAGNLRPQAFWSEMDGAIQKLHGSVHVHSSHERDYRLPTVELRISLIAEVITAIWLSTSPVITARSRIDLRQAADAWLDTLAALMLRPAPVFARVQLASALLAAGFASVQLSSNGTATESSESLTLAA